MNRDQPFAEFCGALHLPGAALGPHSGWREDKDDGIGTLDKIAEPHLPVLGGGDVMPVEIRLETGEIEPGHKLFGQH
jgi:hypothetical protein